MAPAELAVINHSQIQVSQPDPFEPQTWPEMLKFAEMVSKTPFAPKDFQGRPEACAIAMLYGRQLGVGCLQAIQNIYVINGRPAIFGDLFWAIILSRPDFVDVEEKYDDNGAWVKLTRRDRTPKEATFTRKDAEKAGLWGKAGPWTNYPGNQMLWRARTFAGRAVWADALRGMTTSQEAEDYPGQTIEGTPNAEVGKAVAETIPAEKPPAKITQDQAREFGRSWKASGHTMAEAKDALKRICGVESSLDITEDKYEQALKWAQNPKPAEAPAEPSREEKESRAAFGIIGWDEKAQARFIEQNGGDWKKMLGDLQTLVDKRKDKEDL
jgi:hypothetical protein